jgi:hypothetical protein
MELKERVKKRGGTHQHNVFIYLSGHAVMSTQGELQAAVKNENGTVDYVKIVEEIQNVSTRPNCHVIALLDSSKKRNKTKSSQPEKLIGGMHIYSQDSDNNKEQVVEVGNFKMSPMTAAWLSYMRGNPGGQYPDILKDFQWGVSNRCQAVENVDRQLIFV